MRARSTASSINVGARRLNARRQIVERNGPLTPERYTEVGDRFNDEEFGDDLELVNHLTSPSASRGEKHSSMTKELQTSDLLDVPIII